MPELENATNAYVYDLFIGYFKEKYGEGGKIINKGTEEAARYIYTELKRRHPSLNVYFHPVTGDFTSFANTRYADGVVAKKSKSFILVVSDELEKYANPAKSQYIRLRNEGMPPEEDGLPKREILREILACRDNEFFQSLLRNGDVSPVALCVAKETEHFDSTRLFDPEDVGLFGARKSIRVDDFKTFNPLDACNEYYLSSETAIDDIAAFVKKIRSKYHGGIGLGAPLFYVGTRQSDIADCHDVDFKGSICLFGDNGNIDGKIRYSFTSEARIDHNAPNLAADLWVYERCLEVKKEFPNALFYAYNPSIVYDTKDLMGENPYKKSGIIDSFICLNSEEVMALLREKTGFRALCEAAPKDEKGRGIHLIPSVTLNKNQISYNDLLHKLFEEIPANPPRFVIQAPVSSGGVSTFLLDSTRESSREIYGRLLPKVDYICTPYQEHNIPVNVHVFIEKGEAYSEEARRALEPKIHISCPSIQLSRECEHRIIYRGADYIEAQNIPTVLMKEFMRQARLACEALYRKGFYGICGIDGLLCDSFRDDINEDEAFDLVYLLEVNPRFQASSALLNRGLADAHDEKEGIRYPSLQYLNLYACQNGFSAMGDSERKLFEPTENGKYENGEPFANLKVNYSNFCYLNNRSTYQAMHLLSLCEDKEAKEDCEIVEYELDGLDPKLTRDGLVSSNYYEDEAHLYRIVFKTNLCWINTESTLYFNESLLDEDEDVFYYLTSPYLDQEKGDFRKRMLYLKVALLVQGVVFGKGVSAKRPGTFQAIDMLFKSKEKYANFIVNAPIVRPFNLDENGPVENAEKKPDKNDPDKGNVKFTGLSPFNLRLQNDCRIALFYYDFYVDDVLFFPKDELQELPVRNAGDADIHYYDIAYLSTDRLRVHLTNQCKFKRRGKGCKFCGIAPKNVCSKDPITFTNENLQEVISAYVTHYMNNAGALTDEVYRYNLPLRHFLVGGQTADLEDVEAKRRLIGTVRLIRELAGSDAEIYAMIVPCDSGTVFDMQRVGLNQLAFNMEVYDQELAKRWMPGKRSDKTNTTIYLELLDSAKTILEKHESVRSMLLIGLEPLKSTLKGIEELVKRDIQPMLSVFRPMPGTVMKDYMSPQIRDVVKVFEEAEKICDKISKDPQNPKPLIHLGPDCVPCQNNTVSLPYKEEEEE